MIKTEKINLHKDWKVVKQIDVNKKLEKDLEEILGKLVTVGSDSNDGEYRTTIRSVFKKNKNKKKG
ncbi:MAG: hypothetical protein ACTSQF_14085 [Candidatus Heimdallarchaeaceae archaeon]